MDDTVVNKNYKDCFLKFKVKKESNVADTLRSFCRRYPNPENQQFIDKWAARTKSKDILANKRSLLWRQAKVELAMIVQGLDPKGQPHTDHKREWKKAKKATREDKIKQHSEARWIQMEQYGFSHIRSRGVASWEAD